MKIGIVCNALANSGGMERYTLDIIRGFVASGHELQSLRERWMPAFMKQLS